MFMLKLAHWLAVAVLVSFAWLQLNDPDPMFWVALYLVSALAPLMYVLDWPRGRARAYALGLAVGFCLAGLLLVVEGAGVYLDHVYEEPLMQKMNPAKPYIEEARELLGTLIALCFVGLYSWLSLRNR